MFCLAQNQREMFLMRKNHLDFKAVAQALAMDKAKLEDYIMVSLLHMLSYNSTACWCCRILSCNRHRKLFLLLRTAECLHNRSVS